MEKSCKNTLVICHVSGMHELPSEVFVACPSGRRRQPLLFCHLQHIRTAFHMVQNKVFQKTYEMVVAFMGKHRWKEKNVMYSWFSPLSDPENIKWVVEINIPDQLLRKVFQTPRSMSRSPCAYAGLIFFFRLLGYRWQWRGLERR